MADHHVFLPMVQDSPTEGHSAIGDSHRRLVSVFTHVSEDDRDRSRLS